MLLPIHHTLNDDVDNYKLLLDLLLEKKWKWKAKKKKNLKKLQEKLLQNKLFLEAVASGYDEQGTELGHE